MTPLVALLLGMAAGGCESVGALSPGDDDAGQPRITVEIAPDSSQIAEGDSVDLTATVEDSSGNAVDRSLSWSSSDTSVATVDGGRVVGRSDGVARIRAEASGTADTAVVVVTPSSSDGSGSTSVRECSSPESSWIWCDDFEQDRLASYFEYTNPDDSFVRTDGVGVQGSQAMRVRFSEGQVGAGRLHLAFGRTPDPYMEPVDDGTRDYREIYWRLYVRYEESWTGGGGHKLTRAISFATENWAQAMIAHVWSAGDQGQYLVIDPASGTDTEGNLQTTGWNDFDNLRWLGPDGSETPIFADRYMGQWHCIEAQVRLNQPDSTDGVFRLWINGTLEAERTGLNWVGSYTEYGINDVMISNYWNGGAPATQERYIDNFVVSTERIGC